MAKIRLAFVLLSIISISGISDAIFNPKSVVIKNDLGSRLVLSLRCLSADDDLGNHLVPPGETWGFHFRTTYPGTTLFHCGFKWALADEKKFNVYNDDVDRYVCTECSWSIQRKGTCLSRNASTTSHCYPWSPGWPTPTPDYE